MLAKNKRIPRKLFKPLIGSRFFFHSRNFTLRVANSDEIRVSVSVSKKVSKQAVTRNRIRRRAYAVMAELMPNLPNKLFLLIAKPGSLKLKMDDLREELAELMKKG
jgi:ribonuclease P protein component